MSQGVLNFESIYVGGRNENKEKGKFKISNVGIGFKSLESQEILTISQTDLSKLVFQKVARRYQLKIYKKNQSIIQFDGFEKSDYDQINVFTKQHFNKNVELKEISTRGYNWGSVEFDDASLIFEVHGKEAFEIPLADVTNSATAGKTEVFLEFQPPKKDRNAPDSLVELRFYVPGQVTKGQIESSGDKTILKDKSDILKEQEMVDGEIGEISAASQQVAVDDNGDALNAANLLCETIKRKSVANASTSELVVSFDELLSLTPRGRFRVDMHLESFRLRGKSHDYKILYSAITKIFLVPKPDDMHYNMILNIHPPIRQGQTRYPFLVFQFEREDEVEVELNLDQERLDAEFKGLKKLQDGPTFQVSTEIFSGLSGKKIQKPSAQYSSSQGFSGIKCSIKASEAILYPLDKSFLAIPKTPIYIPFVQIAVVTFSRVQSTSTTRTFEMKFSMTGGQEYLFSSIPREEHESLERFCLSKKLNTRNEIGDDLAEVRKEVDYQEEMGSESEDEDFVAKSDQSDVDEEFNEDYSSSSEVEGEDKKRQSKEHSPAESGSGSEPEAEAELEVEFKTKKQAKPKARKSSGENPAPAKKQKKEKKIGPKRPLTSFLYFCAENRQSVRDSNPGITLGEVGKELGRLWKECTEKQKYEDKAVKDKIRYQKELDHFQKTGELPDGTKVDLKDIEKKSAKSTKVKKEESKPDFFKKQIKEEKKGVVKSEEFINEDDDDF